jgi:hypothetical protein
MDLSAAIAKHHLRLWLPLCEPERAPRQQSEQTIVADEFRRSAGHLGRLLHLCRSSHVARRGRLLLQAWSNST